MVSIVCSSLSSSSRLNSNTLLNLIILYCKESYNLVGGTASVILIVYNIFLEFINYNIILFLK